MVAKEITRKETSGGGGQESFPFFIQDDGSGGRHGINGHGAVSPAALIKHLLIGCSAPRQTLSFILFNTLYGPMQ